MLGLRGERMRRSDTAVMCAPVRGCGPRARTGGRPLRGQVNLSDRVGISMKQRLSNQISIRYWVQWNGILGGLKHRSITTFNR
jgi:hypothetical protein